MGKNVIRLNEAQLRKVVAESVKMVLRESELEEGLGDRLSGAWQGFKTGAAGMNNAAVTGNAATSNLGELRIAMQYLEQGNTEGALEAIKMVYNNLSTASGQNDERPYNN